MGTVCSQKHKSATLSSNAGGHIHQRKGQQSHCTCQVVSSNRTVRQEVWLEEWRHTFKALNHFSVQGFQEFIKTLSLGCPAGGFRPGYHLKHDSKQVSPPGPLMKNAVFTRMSGISPVSSCLHIHTHTHTHSKPHQEEEWQKCVKGKAARVSRTSEAKGSMMALWSRAWSSWLRGIVQRLWHTETGMII